MKSKYLYGVASVVAVALIGSAMAGSSPQVVRSSGCHGITYQAVAEQACGCHGLVQPSYVAEQCGCHGRSRGITLAERRIARQAARANHDRTMEAFLDAAQRGDLQGPTTGPKLTTMRMEPVAVAVVEPQKDCPEGE